MLSTLLKPVRELMSIFRKQHTSVQIGLVVILVVVGHFVAAQIRWSMFSQTYIENFAGASEMVLCHMTGCGHCKKMMPEWDVFAKKNVVKTRKVEVNDNPDFMGKHGVKSFPTILLLDDKGKKVDEYQGERNAAAFEAYAKQSQN